MKKKLLKIQVGEAWDKESKKSFPVYATAWQNEDGSYTLMQRIYVQEVEIKGKSKEKVDA